MFFRYWKSVHRLRGTKERLLAPRSWYVWVLFCCKVNLIHDHYIIKLKIPPCDSNSLCQPNICLYLLLLKDQEAGPMSFQSIQEMIVPTKMLSRWIQHESIQINIFQTRPEFVMSSILILIFHIKFYGNIQVITRTKHGLGILVSNIAKETNAMCSLRDPTEVLSLPICNSDLVFLICIFVLPKYTLLIRELFSP